MASPSPSEGGELIPPEKSSFGFKCKDLSVISTSPPNFSISVFKATSLSVSLILSVCKPVKSHGIPKAKQVTAMVCAMSGAFFKSRFRGSKLDFSFFRVNLFSLKLVETPKCL